MRQGRGSHTRWWITALVASAMLGLASCGGDETDAVQPNEQESDGSTQAEPPGSNGRIVFVRADPSDGVLAGEGVSYTVNADGGDMQRLFSAGPSGSPRWSPDGSEILIFCCGDGMAAHLVDPDTGDLRTLAPPDPTLETFCGAAWSPDGERLACEAFGVDDPGRNGIYSIRATDGGGLRRITTNPGGDDIPGDYSPDGNRFVFLRLVEDGPARIFVTEVDGSWVQRISPPGMLVDDTFAGSWSPSGSHILFVARASADHHKAIWVVNADGTAPHQLPIVPACGGPFSDPNSAGCYSPGWSPDGTKIVLARSSPDGQTENIHIVNADGSGLFQVTDGGVDDNPDWGTSPAAS